MSLPMIELHRHLELCVSKKSLLEIANSLHIPIPDPLFITQPMSDLTSVLKNFEVMQKVWATESLIERLAKEACLQAYKENIQMIEFRYSPTYIQSATQNLSWEKIHQAILKGLNHHLPIKTGLIGIIQRTLPLKLAESVMDFIIDHRDSFIGVDLADRETGFNCKPFSKIFKKAKKFGLGITVHAGEENTPFATQSVKDAIDYLEATRIGHGVQIHQSPEMINYVIKKNITLELCLTSNWLTKAVTSIKEHPIRKLLEAGVQITINTDDPGIFGITLPHEYELIKNNFHFSKNELDQCLFYAHQATFLK